MAFKKSSLNNGILYIYKYKYTLSSFFKYIIFWSSTDEIISNVLRWTPSLGRTRVPWRARIYLQQFYADIESSFKDLPRVMDDRDRRRERERERERERKRERERVREIRASYVTWWWWYSFVVHTLFPSVLERLDSIPQNSHQLYTCIRST